MKGVAGMLESYQQAVRFLLNENDYPGATAEELDFFKSQFRDSAYTCRVKSCARATLGFELNKERLRHEATHIRVFRCTFANCHYPFPFKSKQTLKDHKKKYHEPDSPRISIRKPAPTRTQGTRPVGFEASGSMREGANSSLPEFDMSITELEVSRSFAIMFKGGYNY